uniref:Guanylate cyclase activator 2B n=1 Tax=Salvator merianae TaxID=96440 RepID=A0A8D0BPW3_SALMN
MHNWVSISDGDLEFPLESVKKLRELAVEDGGLGGPHARSQLAFIKICKHPELPKDLLPVCERKDAVLVFRRLSLAVQDDDQCELCANTACTGC